MHESHEHTPAVRVIANSSTNVYYLVRNSAVAGLQELLSLHPGEVVELDRAASAPADLLVNGTLIARGEVVVVDEDFGLRISEIVTDAAAELGSVGA